MIEETQVKAVFYSCLSHPVYEKVHNVLEVIIMLIGIYLCVFMLQYCDTVIANSYQEIAPPSVETARIVSDQITLAADGWDVKFEGGNEVKV